MKLLSRNRLFISNRNFKSETDRKPYVSSSLFRTVYRFAGNYTNVTNAHYVYNATKQQPFCGHNRPYRWTCDSWHLHLRTGGFCWCKGHQRVRIREKDAGVHLNSVIYTVCSSVVCSFCAIAAAAAVPPRPQDGTACFSHRTLHHSVQLCDRL